MLSIILKAQNSKEWLSLIFTPQESGELSVAIVGEDRGKHVQFDFDDLEPRDVDDLIWFLSRRREQMRDAGKEGEQS
ncbi:hypothetical protein ACRYJU_07220 [Alloalcanivorax xenomutans]|uniref:hypothetical protein n=1 Tax=Alloalcanivorax xenomutans TaxID=1094342 RepID=UPI003D9B96FE